MSDNQRRTDGVGRLVIRIIIYAVIAVAIFLAWDQIGCDLVDPGFCFWK